MMRAEMPNDRFWANGQGEGRDTGYAYLKARLCRTNGTRGRHSSRLTMLIYLTISLAQSIASAFLLIEYSEREVYTQVYVEQM